jgi:hypothetical protein
MIISVIRRPLPDINSIKYIKTKCHFEKKTLYDLYQNITDLQRHRKVDMSIFISEWLTGMTAFTSSLIFILLLFYIVAA